MNNTMTVPAGIRAVRVVRADGREILGYVTRKPSTFSAADMVPSEKGTLAFATAGFTLVVKALAVRVAPEVAEAVHEGLRAIAGVCNGARSYDDRGFNKVDTEAGKSMAQAPRLSPAQVLYGALLVRKYRKQLEGQGLGHLVEAAQSILPPPVPRKKAGPAPEPAPEPEACATVSF